MVLSPTRLINTFFKRGGKKERKMNLRFRRGRHDGLTDGEWPLLTTQRLGIDSVAIDEGQGFGYRDMGFIINDGTGAGSGFGKVWAGARAWHGGHQTPHIIRYVQGGKTETVWIRRVYES
jgi:hypothetical protein